MDKRISDAYEEMMTEGQKMALVMLGDEARKWVGVSDLPGGNAAGMRLVALSLAIFAGRGMKRRFRITSRGMALRGRIRLKRSLTRLNSMEVSDG